MIVKTQRDQILLPGHQKNKVGFGGVLQWIFWNLVIFLCQCCSEPGNSLLASQRLYPGFKDRQNMNLSELSGYGRFNGKLSCHHAARKLENTFSVLNFPILEAENFIFCIIKRKWLFATIQRLHEMIKRRKVKARCLQPQWAYGGQCFMWNCPRVAELSEPAEGPKSLNSSQCLHSTWTGFLPRKGGNA